MKKTVYILGAGFSMECGATSQAKLLTQILDLKTSKKITSVRQKRKIDAWIKELENFMRNALCVKDSEILHYTLEDIYTPIDKSIIDSISFRNYTPQMLIILRDQINRLIILALRNSIDAKKRIISEHLQNMPYCKVRKDYLISKMIILAL